MANKNRVVSAQLSEQEAHMLEEVRIMLGGRTSDALRYAIREAHLYAQALGWIPE